MAYQHYGSGEEVRPGDKVECADGMEGEVVFTLTPGETTQSDPLCRGYVVRKTDGSNVHYQPSDKGVRLLSRVKRRSSKTMSATIKKEKFLQLLVELGSHTVYYPEPISKQLTDCGISTVMTPDGNGIYLEGHLISASTPEWGEPGISTLKVLCLVYEIATGELPRSEMNGRGFWYRDVINKLASYWDMDKEYSPHY